MTEDNSSKDIYDKTLQQRRLEIDEMHKYYTSVLEKYSLSLDSFSPEVDKLLTELATCQMKLGYKKLDEAIVWCWNVENTLEKQKDTLEIMELTHKIEVIDKKIEKDQLELEKFERELSKVKNELKVYFDEDKVSKEIETLRRKVSCYESSLSSIDAKLAKLQITPEIKPEALKLQLEELNSLKAEWEYWRSKAHNAKLVQEAKQSLQKYRSSNK